MNLLEFAKRELDLLGMTEDSEDINLSMREAILDIVNTFQKQGFSGFSGNYAINCLEKILRYHPISPLTGKDDEWVYIGDIGCSDTFWQNKRCPSIFKNKNGEAYNTDGIVFYEEKIDNNGDSYNTYFTNSDSRVYITFPYTPTTVYKKYKKRE